METFDLIEALRRTGRRGALATLVRTLGTTPRKEGAKMLVDEEGQILGSVTIGGCVDARVIEEAGSVLASGAPKSIEMQLGDEEAWEIGLTCGGTVALLIEPLSPSDPNDAGSHWYDAARVEAYRGEGAALITVVGGERISLGARMLIGAGGAVEGSFGADLDARLLREIPPEIRSRSASITRRYPLSEGEGVDLFIDFFTPPPTLLIFGAGAVAIPLASLGKEVGFRIVVVDGRPRFAHRGRFPGADEIHVGIPSEIAEKFPFNPATWVVLVAHDYKYDIPVLLRVLQQEVPYIGMLGSRRRGKAIFDRLREKGVEERQLARIRVPIGLDLGAETTAEIAVSILAEMVAVKHGKESASLSRGTGVKK
jgi:xanthine dehydrogenase accessory factor